MKINKSKVVILVETLQLSNRNVSLNILIFYFIDNLTINKPSYTQQKYVLYWMLQFLFKNWKKK